ncbi:site-specific integrase [Deinococcus psychrotolerans]|uniref:Site-specific integrase n=1 Tax=Deinococcus psychrotolerans TaxID=2489213 RepID=A0A3G8YGP8_9DEIO|nr:site-specific integrase [Deinococcus psychrotolerans]AZI44115.1 site-specific integrase [Deinococcus psychrotolerans]
MPERIPEDQNLTLDLYRGDLLALTKLWTGLHDDELKRRAVKAAGEKDITALVSLTTAYLGHAGGSGVLTSPHTVLAYERGVRQFLTWATNQAVGLLRPGRHDAQSYVNALLAAGRAPSGVSLRVAAASCLYRALRWAGATEARPFEDVRVPKDPTPGLVKRPPYTEDDLHDVLKVADGQARFLILLISHAGLRISEALALKWPDIDEAARRLTVTSGKGRKARIVAMSTSLARASRDYRAIYGPGGTEQTDGQRTTTLDHVFRFSDTETARYHIVKAFKLGGVKFRGFHPGRKYAGTKLLTQIKDFGRVAAHLGHESVDTTRKGYAALPVDDLKSDLSGW